ncbi:MAG: GNAT family N-acetyltransferase [Bacillota bacterium]|nr:GNAT family N-acetyltransferase [Bacillota bacterium]
MYKSVKLNNKNLADFKLLNANRVKFNSLNEDFFKIYDELSLLKKMALRRNVNLLKNGENYIGYIWTNKINERNCSINSMSIENCENVTQCYKILLSSLNHCLNLTYLCEDKNENTAVLKAIGFKNKSCTLSMYSNLETFNYFSLDTDISFKRLDRGNDEDIRCKIQNEVFQKEDRIPLYLDDIYYDEDQNYYYDEGAIFIKKKDKYIGYGQIIIENNMPTIVNFGILKEYQGKGYGKQLLAYLLNILKTNNFNKVFIKVNADNQIAINLYKSYGFHVYSKASLWEICKGTPIL